MSHNTVLHRLVRPAVVRLAGTALQPNHLTILRIVTGLTAAVAFSVGLVGSIRIGSVLFVASALLDRADGELARQTGRFTEWGHRLDLFADLSADAIVILAISIGALHTWLGWWAPALGVSGAVSVAVLFWQLNRPSRQSGQAVSRPVDPDDAILGVPLLACLVGLPPVLLLAGVLTPLVACWLMVRDRWPVKARGFAP